MLRCRIELVPGGDETCVRTIGMVEIGNIKTHPNNTADYAVVLKKTVPFEGALKRAWRKGEFKGKAIDFDKCEEIHAWVAEHHRTRRGVYDLLYRALKACGLEERV